MIHHLIQIFKAEGMPKIRVWQNSIAGYDYTIESSDGTNYRSTESYDDIKEKLLSKGYKETLA